MEIADYVRLIARRSRFVGIVAVAAAVVATLLFLTRPRTYVATTTIIVPTPPGSTSLFAAVSQSVSDFQAAVASGSVASQVASDLGVPLGDLAGAVEAERVSDSGVVELRFEYGDREVAEQVVESVSRGALILLLEARLEPFAAQLEIAQGQYDDAQEEYNAFLEENGFVNPELFFQQEENEAQDLRNQIGAALTQGDVELAEALQERLEEKTARNAPLAAEFQAIQSAQRRTDTALSAAQVANDQALGALESIEEGSSGAISAAKAVGVSRTQTFAKTVVPAIVIATILAIVLVVLLEIVPARRSPIRARLKSRLSLDERFRSTSIVSRLQALAARRQEKADRGAVAPGTEASGDPGAGFPSSQTSRASDGMRPRERPKRRVRLDPAEEALAAAEGRAAQEAKALAAERARARAAEEARVRAAEQTSLRATEEARARAAEQTSVRATEQARARAGEEARARAGEEAGARAAEEAAANAAEEAKRKADQEATAKAAEEAKRKAAEPGSDGEGSGRGEAQGSGRGEAQGRGRSDREGSGRGEGEDRSGSEGERQSGSGIGLWATERRARSVDWRTRECPGKAAAPAGIGEGPAEEGPRGATERLAARERTRRRQRFTERFRGGIRRAGAGRGRSACRLEEGPDVRDVKAKKRTHADLAVKIG